MQFLSDCGHLGKTETKQGDSQGGAGGVSGPGEKAVECCLCEGSGRVPVKQAEAGGRRGGWSCQQEERECCEGRVEMGQGEGGSDGGQETGQGGGEEGHVHLGVEGQGHHEAEAGECLQCL